MSKKSQTLVVLILSLIFIWGGLWGGTAALAAKLPVAIPDTPDTTLGWRLLDQDDNIDLSSFTKTDVNTPAKLTGGAFDRGMRDYYLFFGHVGSSNNYTYATSTFSTIGNMYARLGRAFELPLLGPMIIGVKKQTDASQKSTRVFGYDFDYSRTYTGETGSRFDIGDVEQNLMTGKWEVKRAGRTSGSSNVNDIYIMEQYVKDNEIVAYGYYGRGVSSSGTSMEYMPVRVHGYVVDFETGRVRYDISYYNNSGQIKNYAMTHASHMDVGGNHMSSKLYSYGDAGIYFDEPTKTIVDGIPARIYFYTNAGYNQMKGPNATKIGDLGPTFQVGNWFAIHKGGWKLPENTKMASKLTGATDAYQAWDAPMPKDTYYSLTHPIFALRWEINTIESNKIGTGSLDLSIEEPAELKPKAIKTFDNLTELTPKKNVVGDILEFTLSATNSGAGVIHEWSQLTLSDTMPKELELVRDSLSVTDTDGTVTNLAPTDYQFDQRPETSSFKLNKLYSIAPDKEVKIKYKAKIISGTNTTIINRFFASNPVDQNAVGEVKIPISEEPAKPEAAKTYTNNTSTDGKDRMDDSLTFELSASNTGEAPWQEVGWKDEYPAELELDKESFVLVDDKGVEKKVTPIFHASLPSFTVSDTPLEVQAGKKITLRYKAKIISGEGTTITNKVTAYTVSDSTKKAEAQVAIPVFPKKPLIKDLTIHFVNKAGEKIAEPIIRSETIGSIVKLKEEAETVGSALYNAIKAVEANQFKLVERPANEASVEIIDGVNEVTYVFDGKLLLYSAPNRINFSTHKYDGKTTRVNAPAYDQDLVVKDGRSVKDKWTLTAKLTAEMTHIDPAHKDSVLKNAIRYVYEGKEIILDKGAQPIMVHTNEAEKELYNISTTWNGTKAGDGFKLEVDPGDVKKLGSYQGEILWELAATPDP
ncbi:hypothetical protein A5821_002835 [Enterococcus sp. 7F3_DIV0205]|uniref:WxL domain-containing protein n=1 Tax=Candidatus Enterococcus palustris TaxID=1834189 RepID=A0AAQ3WAN3_9ENTE